MKRKSTFTSPIMIVLFVILMLYSISLLLPMLWGFFTSLKENAEFRVNVIGLPKGKPWEWAWSNYQYVFSNFFYDLPDALRKAYLFEMFANTMLYAVGGAFFATFTPCIAAYLTARFNFRFSKFIYVLVIVAMVLPIVGSLPSEIEMAVNLGFVDNFLGIYVLKANFLGLYFLVFYAVFKTIPKDFSEAGYIDGAGNFTILFRIMLPLARNAFFTIMLLKFIEFWNDYQVPLVYLPNKPTLALGMFDFYIGNTNALSWTPLQIAGCMLLLIPILVIFLFLHNRLIGNLSMGGIKE